MADKSHELIVRRSNHTTVLPHDTVLTYLATGYHGGMAAVVPPYGGQQETQLQYFIKDVSTNEEKRPPLVLLLSYVVRLMGAYGNTTAAATYKQQRPYSLLWKEEKTNEE